MYSQENTGIEKCPEKQVVLEKAEEIFQPYELHRCDDIPPVKDEHQGEEQRVTKEYRKMQEVRCGHYMPHPRPQKATTTRRAMGLQSCQEFQS